LRVDASPTTGGNKVCRDSGVRCVDRRALGDGIFKALAEEEFSATGASWLIYE